MLEAVLRLLARLHLSWLHRIGAFAGRMTYRFAPRYAAQLTDNVAASGLADDPAAFVRICAAAVAETGKGLMELPAIWFRPADAAAALVVETHGWESVEAARAAGRGILFLTPHLGCFEVSALYAAMRMPITILYRPPKLKWLEPLMRTGRSRCAVRQLACFPSLDNLLISAGGGPQRLPQPPPPTNATSRRSQGKAPAASTGADVTPPCSDQAQAAVRCAATRSNKVSMILLTKRCSVLLSL